MATKKIGKQGPNRKSFSSELKKLDQFIVYLIEKYLGSPNAVCARAEIEKLDLLIKDVNGADELGYIIESTLKEKETDLVPHIKDQDWKVLYSLLHNVNTAAITVQRDEKMKLHFEFLMRILCGKRTSLQSVDSITVKGSKLHPGIPMMGKKVFELVHSKFCPSLESFTDDNVFNARIILCLTKTKREEVQPLIDKANQIAEIEDLNAEFRVHLRDSTEVFSNVVN